MTHKRPDTVRVPRRHYDAVRRVLVLVDGYMSVLERKGDVLMSWDGGMMTWGELRQHAQAAINLLPPKPRKRK